MSHARYKAVIAAIGREELGLATLELRNSDSLDFHDLHVGRIKAALTRAYREGGEAAVDVIFRHAKAAGSHDT
jgi:hypothetical protein